MCMFSQPDIPAPQPVVERSGSRLPDGDTARSTAGRRTMDRARSGASTILTGGMDQSTVQTQGKTLLGQ